MQPVFPGIWRHNGRLLTRNLVSGVQYSETLVRQAGVEYRTWDPNTSKPAAAIEKGLKHFPLRPGQIVLYLGIANGKTASFFSDILGSDGLIYGIEISPRSLRDLVPIAERRGNIVPILADARMPEKYPPIEKADSIFQDVATNDQSDIAIRNAKAFLKPEGFVLLSLKSRSLDVVKKPDDVYAQEEKKLKAYFTILEKVRLDPYEKDHMFYVLSPKH